MSAARTRRSDSLPSPLHHRGLFRAPARVAVLVVALASLAGLTACGGAPGASGASPASAAPAPADGIDLTGEWVLTVESPNGTGTRSVTFVQEGDRLTGTISSSMAAGELEGTVEGNEVSFVAEVAMSSGTFPIVYDAVYRDGRLVEGFVDFGDYGSGTFTGERR